MRALVHPEGLLESLAEDYGTTVGRMTGRLCFSNSPYHRWLRAVTFEDADFTCKWCHARCPNPPTGYDGRRAVRWYDEFGESFELQVDHVFPRILNGLNVLWNLQCLCNHCNMTKGCRPL